MNGDRAIHLAAPAEQAAQGELDLGGIPVGLGHAREDFRGAIEAVIDEVIQANVVVTRQAHGACRGVTAPKYPGGEADEHECESEQEWRQLDH